MDRLELVITGNPITKKNSQRIISVGGRWRIIPSKQFVEYERNALYQLFRARSKRPKCPIDVPVNVSCVYYMKTRRKVDLVNLMEATMDILVDARVLMDDHSRIVASHDGCAVLHDKDQPRVEIVITGKGEENERKSRQPAGDGERRNHGAGEL